VLRLADGRRDRARLCHRLRDELAHRAVRVGSRDAARHRATKSSTTKLRVTSPPPRGSVTKAATRVTYAERRGLDQRHLTAITVKNLGNARANPKAQTRGWTVDALSDKIVHIDRLNVHV
jgi:acetyl-CoA acetyltransferase